LLGVDND